uniref:Uncharacterized protein n=1 Tax=viral metagenome TaxID=1070528 RepID=A0A6C0M1I2_9ZZZZ
MNEEYYKEYLQKLTDMIDAKKLDGFWVMCDRSDFKPIKKNKVEIRKMLKEKSQYYAGKKIAYVNLYPNLDAIKDSSEDAFIMTIYIYEINDKGEFGKTQFDTWGLKIRYKLSDFSIRKFKMKDVEKLMRLCADEIITTEILNGSSFKNFMKKLDKLKINLDD